jgi:septation ring formation regulator EzrA
MVQGRLLTAVTAGVLLLGACSSSADDPATFAKAYRQVTDTYRVSSESVRTEGQEVDGVDRLLDVYEQLLTATEAARDGYSDLQPPSEFQSTLGRMVTLLEQEADALSELIASAREEDLEETQSAASRLTSLVADWNVAMQRMEELLDACGEPCSV